nr:YqhG family protein [Paenibacillus sp. OSY-SE]
MNTEQVRRYVMRYLEATDCHILEKSPAYTTVKLSERADRVLTNRPYYWGFVDRTGAEPETMRFTFVFDPAAMPQEPPRGPGGAPMAPTVGDAAPYAAVPAAAPGSTPAAGAAAATPPVPGTAPDSPAIAPGDSILGRYFGVAPAFTGGGGGPGRIPREDVTHGSRRLEQIMQAAHSEGRFVSLFVEPAADEAAARPTRGTRRSAPYEPWLLLNLKLEFACDLKREEIHSYGISLVSGKMRTSYMEEALAMQLTPKLPPHVHVLPWRMTIQQARSTVEEHLVEIISRYDDTWASEASARLEEELARLAAYYEPLLQETAAAKRSTREAAETEPTDKLTQIKQQYDMRSQELRWQFEPRIHLSLINAGVIHVPSTVTR